jgi:hypothetical protein
MKCILILSQSYQTSLITKCSQLENPYSVNATIMFSAIRMVSDMAV